MKKLFLLSCFAVSAVLLTQCGSSKKAAGKAQAITYTSNIQPVVAASCTPCHFPDKGGRMKALNTYDAVKGDIDDIISRIEKHPGEKGFMPMKRERLSDSTINLFKQWKESGMLQ